MCNMYLTELIKFLTPSLIFIVFMEIKAVYFGRNVTLLI
jgi:hypothetical protein